MPASDDAPPPTLPPHLNQPGGPPHASALPQVAGRERELRALADAVRRLIDATVTHTADAATTAAIAARVDALADELAALVPDPVPARYGGGLGSDSHPHDHFQFDVMLGLYHPGALPVRMTWDPPRAVGEARFGWAYEGPPGCVHGAVIAGVFDQVFNVANVKSGVAGPTANLSLDYRRPTRLHRDLVFEGWVERVDGRKVHTKGRLVQDGHTTVEASGLFLQFDPESLARFQREG
jgi:acyl-coenzyme A thioesterase PaaI-like protein